MQDYQLPLIQKLNVAFGTKSFIFEKPNGFNYIPGQYAYFTLNELKFPDARGKLRQFTISSSPTEKDLSITVRVRAESGFKKTLDELEIGQTIQMRGPTGDFCLNEKDNRLQVMIAGGIGITPFRSIIKYVSDKNLENQIQLIYANNNPAEISFKDELTSISKKNKNIKVAFVVNKAKTEDKWSGYTGYIDEDIISKCVGDEKNCVYWLCGPPGMVQSMEHLLDKLNISQDMIKIEKFSGY